MLKCQSCRPVCPQTPIPPNLSEEQRGCILYPIWDILGQREKACMTNPLTRIDTPVQVGCSRASLLLSGASLGLQNITKTWGMMPGNHFEIRWHLQPTLNSWRDIERAVAQDAWQCKTPTPSGWKWRVKTEYVDNKLWGAAKHRVVVKNHKLSIPWCEVFYSYPFIKWHKPVLDEPRPCEIEGFQGMSTEEKMHEHARTLSDI